MKAIAIYQNHNSLDDFNKLIDSANLTLPTFDHDKP